MPSDIPADQRLARLNREIEQREAELPSLKAERSALASQAARATRRFRYLRLLQQLRAPAANFDLWPQAVLLVGPAVTAVLLFIATNLITRSFPLSLLMFVLGLIAGAGLFAMALYRPDDAVLPVAIAEAESQSRLFESRLADATRTLAEANGALREMLEERRELMASGKVQRAALLQRNWKAMRGAEWEDYLVEVCRTLGATVRRTGRVGEPGAATRGKDVVSDPAEVLLLEFHERRVAALATSPRNNISSATIQQALAARDRQTCDGCAILTNGHFTGAAQDFAQRNGCTLVGRNEFPDFVMGKIEL